MTTLDLPTPGVTAGPEWATKLNAALNALNSGKAETSDVAPLIPKSLVDAKGDLIVGTADNTVSRLPVGSNGQVLTADSAQSAGVKWATPSGGGGVVGSVLLEVSRAGSSVALAAGSFTTYPLDNIVQNDGGGSYNTTTYIYTVPEDGLYLCFGSIRMQDNSATRSVAVGIATSNADGPFVLWDHMGLVDNTPSGAGVGRSGRQYVRLCRFDENDQVRMFIYSQGATFPTHYQTPVNGGPAGQSMVIMKVAD